MSPLHGLGTLTRAYLIQSFRSKTALFWNVGFPLLWLFLYGFVFARGNDVSLFIPGLFSITIISGAFFGVSYVMVAERENGILRRYRVTPVTALTVVIASGTRAIVLMSLSLIVQASVGWLVFRFTVNGSLFLTGLMMLVGAVAFVPLGLLVGSVAQDMRTAPAINNLLFFPMVFATGAAFPYFLLPRWLQFAGRTMPSSYLVELLQGVMLRGEGILQLLAPLAVLLLTAIVGAFVNSWVFRWESSEPIDKGKLLLAIAVLAALFLGAALITPGFGMAQAPPGIS